MMDDTENSEVSDTSRSSDTNATVPCPFSVPQPAHHNDGPYNDAKNLAELGLLMNELVIWDETLQGNKKNAIRLLKNMFDKRIMTDIKITIGDAKYKCHLKVVQCYSNFFKQLDKITTIELPPLKITPEGFEQAYEWMRSATPKVQRAGILELFNAGFFLEMKPLTEQCWSFMENDKYICEDSALLLYMETLKYDCDPLIQLRPLMLTRIFKFFLTLVASKEFLELNAKDLCTLIGSNKLGVNTEIEVFFSAVRWLRLNWDARKEHVVEIMKCVRFGLMPPWYLAILNTQMNESELINAIVRIPEVKSLITDGILYATMKINPNITHFYRRTPIIQRQWIFDIKCNYHHHLKCSNMQNITFNSFIEYLKIRQAQGNTGWKSLPLANDEATPMLPPCCLAYCSSTTSVATITNTTSTTSASDTSTTSNVIDASATLNKPDSGDE